MDYEDIFKDAMPESKHLAPLEGKDLFVMMVMIKKKC